MWCKTLLALVVPFLLYGCASLSEVDPEGLEPSLPPPTNDAYCIQKYGVLCAELPPSEAPP